MIRRVVLSLTLIGFSAPVLAQDDALRLTRPDFDLPLGIAEQIPPGVPPEEVFVSDDFCFYYRQGGKFYRIDCVG